MSIWCQTRYFHGILRMYNLSIWIDLQWYNNLYICTSSGLLNLELISKYSLELIAYRITQCVNVRLFHFSQELHSEDKTSDMNGRKSNRCIRNRQSTVLAALYARKIWGLGRSNLRIQRNSSMTSHDVSNLPAFNFSLPFATRNERLQNFPPFS